MARKTDNNEIHYNASVPPLRLKQDNGVGACGQEGTVTGYAGCVTCPDCQPVAEADLQTIKDHTNGRHK